MSFADILSAKPSNCDSAMRNAFGTLPISNIQYPLKILGMDKAARVRRVEELQAECNIQIDHGFLAKQVRTRTGYGAAFFHPGAVSGYSLSHPSSRAKAAPAYS